MCTNRQTLSICRSDSVQPHQQRTAFRFPSSELKDLVVLAHGTVTSIVALSSIASVAYFWFQGASTGRKGLFFTRCAVHNFTILSDPEMPFFVLSLYLTDTVSNFQPFYILERLHLQPNPGFRDFIAPFRFCSLVRSKYLMSLRSIWLSCSGATVNKSLSLQLLTRAQKTYLPIGACAASIA